jgi:hypothetical protein
MALIIDDNGLCLVRGITPEIRAIVQLAARGVQSDSDNVRISAAVRGLEGADAREIGRGRPSDDEHPVAVVNVDASGVFIGGPAEIGAVQQLAAGSVEFRDEQVRQSAERSLVGTRFGKIR